MTWVPIFDATGPGFPSGTAKAKAAGVKAVAGYRGSTAWKKFTPSLRDQWRGAGFGIVAMFEADDPTRGYFRANGGRPNGIADGQAARADWRAIGYPDSCFIAYAYDGNTGPANYPNIKAYFQGIVSVDTCLPWAYIEPDVGELLFADGLIGGIFAPAAYGWDPLGRGSFDRPHVFWKQLHNGVTTLGGNVDMGEIRDDANLWWPEGHTAPITGDDDMATVVTVPAGYSNAGKQVDAGTALAMLLSMQLDTRNRVIKAAASADPKALAAELAPLLPAGALTQAEIEAALRNVFADAAS
jgi:hypothetical protein